MSIDVASIRCVTFDCYGTLVDWETGILGAAASLAGCTIEPHERADVLDAYAAAERQIEAGEYLPYREVLRRVAHELAARFHWSIDSHSEHTISESIIDWPAFDETPGALRALQERFSVGILSNIDNDLFATTAPKLGIELDLLVTAEQVRSYKPAEVHFHEAMERMKLPASAVLHVAESRYHDVAPASRLGFPTVWVNRAAGGASASGASDASPDLTVTSLGELIQHLG
ncbi:MAG: haloacid dehalogenase type II [Planctomycetota bacterium]